MARPTGKSFNKVAVVKQATAAIAAESATLTDANFPPASGFDCSGLDTVFLGVEITAGTNPTMTVELLLRDDEAADGSRWRRLLLGAKEGITPAASLALETTGALASDGSMVEMRVFGRRLVIPRVTAVANAAGTTAWKILMVPGRARPRLREV